jgi:hypothetical protein
VSFFRTNFSWEYFHLPAIIQVHPSQFACSYVHLVIVKPSILSVYPSVLVDGKSQSVTIRGSRFNSSDTISCIIRSQSFPSVLLTPDALRCVLPPMRLGSFVVSVSGSLDVLKVEVVKSNTTSSVNMISPTFFSIHPSQAFLSISSLFSVIGIVLPAQVVSCIFGTQVVGSLVTTISCIDRDDCISCLTPTSIDSLLLGIIQFGILSGGNYSDTVPFRLIRTPEIHSINPSKVPSQHCVQRYFFVDARTQRSEHGYRRFSLYSIVH